MGLRLGIDTGGTYTDAVLVDAGQRVRAQAKALTTHDDLTRGIAEALEGVLPRAEEPITLVSLSTTLATNALVEGQGSPVALLLVGQAPAFLQRGGLGDALAGDPVAFIGGGHDGTGNEREPLDLDAARTAIEQHAPRAAAFAVSGFFATRNPAHEQRLQALVHELTGRPVSMGYEFSAALDAPRRALTALLNARLVPLLSDLIAAARRLLMRHDIAAPLMVVRGDGSLMGADFARARPVETILSGPAASLVGARVLADEPDAVVLDIGGTTSDIGVLAGGEPRRNGEGAVIGGWRTRVKAVDVHTFGIGGDSAVRIDMTAALGLGPDRSIPLSLLASHHPGVERILAEQAEEQPLREHAGWFAVRRRDPVGGAGTLSPTQRLLWSRLGAEPVSLVELFDDQTRRRALDRLIARGCVTLAGFTPTDAAHVIGDQAQWSVTAARDGARIGARLWYERQGGEALSAVDFARRVRAGVEQTIGRSVLAASLADTELAPGGSLTSIARAMADRSIGARTPWPGIDMAMHLTRPLIVLGAPASLYGDAVAGRLGTRAVVPPHAEVANAVGAVAAGIVQQVVVTILPLAGERFRVHTPDGVSTLDDLDEARQHAAAEAERLARSRGEAAGAGAVEVELAHDDTIGRSDTGDEVFFQGRVTATARGYPQAVETG